ncbi:hypothetical protein B0T16DRAFT_403239 [Cercophora newfieldiana]|uniref:Uncharacterized protein n=1 Tax=Cercophora newfieldiana TaxID=92897 RepID=A0AA40CVX5_9PEZI|nr:hypothetical protein B0T16DRAFT_403239 [Cercophora newfieldiana]
MATSTLSSTRYPIADRQDENLGDFAASEKWERSPAYYPANSDIQPNSDGSDGDPTPDSTFSAPEHEPSSSRRSTPASSVCGQECKEAEPGVPQSSPSSETETRPPPGKILGLSSILTRFRSPRERTELSHATHPEPPPLAVCGGAVVLPIPSRGKMYHFKGGLFVGFPDQVPSPSQQAERFEKEISPRFWTDASEFQRKLARTRLGFRYPPSISLELRMSGYASSRQSRTVELAPRIWLLYDHNRWKKDVRKFVQELEWLDHAGFGPVEIQKGSPKLATLSPPLFVEGLPMHPRQGFALSGELCLYLHTEARPDTSAIGRLCCASVAKNGTVCGQRISRIGGLVCIDSQRKLAVTTAHGMFDLAWDVLLNFESDAEGDLDSPGSSPTSDYCDSDDSSDFGDTTWDEPTWPAIPSSFNSEEARQWEPVEILGATSFLGSASLDPEFALNGLREVEPHRQDTDFSLWRIPGADGFVNGYLPFNQPIRVWLQDDSPPSFVMQSADPVDLKLLLSPKRSLQVQLLPGKSQFMVRGVLFTGRRIRTTAPLGAGYSGSWLTYGTSLVGMLIASYENEPYAHLIPSDILFANIRNAIPKSTSVGISMPVDDLILEQSVPAGLQSGRTNVYGPSQPLNNSSTPCIAQEPSNTVTLDQDQEPSLMTFTQGRHQETGQLTKLMSEETRRGAWPKTPLKMTAAKFSEVQARLATVFPKVEKVAKALRIWYSLTNDTIRARKFLRFKLHIASQQKTPKELQSLKDYPSITVEDLDKGYQLLESIAKDLAVRFPSFLKSNGTAQRWSQESRGPIGQLQPPIPLTLANGSERVESNGRSPGRKRPSGLELASLQKRTKNEPPPHDQNAHETSVAVDNPTEVADNPTPSRYHNMVFGTADNHRWPKLNSSTALAVSNSAKPANMAAPLSQKLEDTMEDPWANSTIDPHSLFASSSLLKPFGAGFLGVFTTYRSSTPNDTPESSKDSGASEPNSDISEGSNLDIDPGWQQLDDDGLVLFDMSGFTMDTFNPLDEDFMGAKSFEFSSLDDIPNDSSKPFQFDSSLYFMDV